MATDRRRCKSPNSLAAAAVRRHRFIRLLDFSGSSAERLPTLVLT
jgi:hypothetical protein